MEEILLNIESKERRFAHLKNGQLYDLTIERKKVRQLTGNIYKGKVINILKNIQSAFIDISESENGFIHISDIIENTKKLEQMFDMDFDREEKSTKAETNTEIDQLMKLDQFVLVQVVKDPIGSKGARLTSKLSIPGRYLVLLPNSGHRGVSRKIEDRASRDRLKKIVRSFEMPRDMGLICRTASQHVTTDMLIDEAHDLLESWKEVMEKFHSAQGSACLYEESDLIKKSVLQAVDKKFDRILVDDYETFQRCKRLYNTYAKEHPLSIEFYRDKAPIFERFNIEKEIDKALRRKIWLSSGGYLYFDRTEAMCTIDVNSGRSTKEESNLEEALVRINIEAATEIGRQLRLRNIGGLIICDFIDMRSRKNRRRVLEHVKESMKTDSAKCTILGMSDFGLVEMTRQRSRESLHQTLFCPCPYCNGDGNVKTHESVSIELERSLKKAIFVHQVFALKVECHPKFARHLDMYDKHFLASFAKKQNASIEFLSNDELHINDYKIYSSTNNEPLEI